MSDRISQLVKDRIESDPEHAEQWKQVGQDLRDIEAQQGKTGRTECSMCFQPGDPWEFDDSGRCADCAP